LAPTSFRGPLYLPKLSNHQFCCDVLCDVHALFKKPEVLFLDAKFFKRNVYVCFENVAFANVNQLSRNLKLLEVIWSSE